MLFALDVCLCLEAIVLLATVERLVPGMGWAALACAVAIDIVTHIPTRYLTEEERAELLKDAPYLEDDD